MIFEMGSDAINIHSLIFMASFIVPAIVSVLVITGKTKPWMILIAGALPFAITVFSLLRINALTQEVVGVPMNMQDISMLFEGTTPGIGLFSYYIGAAVLIFFGILEMRNQPKVASGTA